MNTQKCFFVLKVCLQRNNMGSGCGSVGRVVASDTRGSWFESRHPQILYWTLFIVNCANLQAIKRENTLNSLYRHCVNRLPTLLTNGPIDCVGHEAPWWTDRSLDLSPSKTQWCDRYLYSESSEDITSFVRSDLFT